MPTGAATAAHTQHAHVAQGQNPTQQQNAHAHAHAQPPTQATHPHAQALAAQAQAPVAAHNPYQAYGLPNVDMSSFQGVDWSSMYGMGMYV